MEDTEVMKNMEYRGMQVLLAGSFFLFGLFHEYAACIFGGLFGLLLLAVLVRQKRLAFYLNMESITILFLAAMYLVTAIYGVDHGMGLIGFFKFLPVPLFLCCVMQMGDMQRQGLLELVPWAGCVMTVIGMVSYLIPLFYGFFFTADRLGGFFQYANVFALFCLWGVIILSADFTGADRKGMAGKLAVTAVLMAGIFLSGSRTVMLLLVAACLILAAGERRLRIPLILMLCLALAGIFLYVASTGNVQNVGRFLTISLKSSTFLGRLLYWKDGISLLLQHPFGLGYLGYYYMEPSIQTGVYSVRYIHNDFLQVMLDVGIIPGLLVLLCFLKNIFGKGRRLWQRLLVAVTGIQCFLDFSLEFTALWLAIVPVLDVYRGKELGLGRGEDEQPGRKGKDRGPEAGGKKAVSRIGLAVLLGISLFSLYLGASMIPRYAGKPEISLALVPFYTEAGTEVLAAQMDLAEAEALAEKLLKQNRYVAEAYDILGIAAYRRGDFQAMARYKKQSLWLQKYNMEAYERYVALMSQAIALLNEQGDIQGTEWLMRETAAVPGRLKEVAETTDSLAYQIRDVPDFTLAEEVSGYIRELSELLE